MGKYNYKDHVEKEENTPELYFQFCIANELAEANRLKRLELRQIRTRVIDGIDNNGFKIGKDSISNEELEDKA